jgi:hypothetical protein
MELQAKNLKNQWKIYQGETPLSGILGMDNGNVKRYAEDPSSPTVEALEVLSASLDDIGILVSPPCAPLTFQEIGKKAFGLKKILVVDNNPERLKLWKDNVPWEEIEDLEVVELPVDNFEAEQILKQKLEEFDVQLFLGKSSVYIPKRFRRLDPELSKFIESKVLFIQQEACTNAAFKTTRSWHITMNQLLNLKRTRFKTFDLNDSVTGQPVVIVGAGPSLDYNIKVLKKYADRAIIVATDASLNTLIENDIKPDFVASLEDVHLSWRFFVNHLDKLKDVPLILPLNGNHVLARDYPGELVMVSNPLAENWLKPLLEKFPQAKFGQCVGHFVYHIAEALKASEIIMTGFDMAFRGDSFHLKSNACPYHKDHPDSFTYVEVEGIDGKPVKTDLSMSFYLKYFERELKNCVIPVMDATEGGALIKGTGLATLENALKDQPVKKRINLKANSAFKNAETEDYLAGLFLQIDEIHHFLKEVIPEVESMSKANISNPLSNLPLESEAFNLLGTCCNMFLMTEFADLAGTYSPERFRYYRELLLELVGELSNSAVFLKALFELRQQVFGSEGNNTLMLMSEADLNQFSPKRSNEDNVLHLDSLEPLPKIWDFIRDNDISKIVVVNGDILPDVWSVPDISCLDIKNKFSPHSYERSLWIPGYRVLCSGTDIFKKWQDYLPSDIDCELLEDTF